VATQSDARAATAFGELVTAMYLTAAAQNGLISLDFCHRTDDKRHMARVVRLMLHRLSGDVKAQRIDEQQYWLYEFPTAA
jgi:hypothetical protein